MNHIIHNVDFTANLGGISPLNDLIRGEYTYKLRISDKEFNQILKYISDKDYPGIFMEGGARLYIKTKTDEIFVTANGRVKTNKEVYVMSPYKFLLLADFLEKLKVKNGIKEGVPKYY